MYMSLAPAAAGRRKPLLRACYLSRTAIRGDSGPKTVNFDFPKGDILTDRDRLYSNNEIRGMVERNVSD